jgi:hypothetical protein
MTAQLHDHALTSPECATIVVSGSDLRPSWSPRERLALWIGAGVAGGLALASLSPRHWSRLGALLFGGSARILRSPIGPALLAAILARASAPAARAQTVNVELGTAPPANS